MAKPASTSTEWQVLEHGPLEQLAENLWRVEGGLPDMPLRRQMIVVRDQDGRLVVHNAVATRDDVRTEIEALGELSVLIVPNGWHRIDAARFKARYPALKVFCPRGVEETVGKVVAVDGSYDAFPAIGGISVEHLEGMKPRAQEGVLRVTSSDGVSLVFNDAVFNHPHVPGLTGLVFRLLGSSGGPRVTRVARMSMIQDKKAFKAHLLRLAETPGLVRVIPGHVEVIAERAPEVLKAIANGL